jgi:hypothetical protein
MLLKLLAKPLPALLLMWATLPRQQLMPQQQPLPHLPSKFFTVLGCPANKAGS